MKFLKDRNIHDYYIGLLATDGNLRKIGKKKDYRITLAFRKRDEYILHHFKEYLNLENNVKTRVVNGKEYSILSFGEKELHTYLNNIGITPNKSLTMNLSIDITYNMLRGIIDGDGNVYCKKDGNISLRIYTASKPFLDNIETFFKKEEIPYTVRFDKCWVISINRQNVILYLYQKMYDQAIIFNKSKKSTFENGRIIKKLINENVANSVKAKPSFAKRACQYRASREKSRASVEAVYDEPKD